MSQHSKPPRSISIIALLFTSVSAILGSGWLFTAYYSSSIAGPASLLSWVLGGGFTIIVAFVFAELAAMLPVTGSSTRIPYFTHGTVVSFMFSWMIWLSYLALAPTEIQAVIQYLSFEFPQLTHANGGLTHQGYGLATLLMVAICIINTYSLRWLIRSNSILTVAKIIIPLIAVVAILSMGFSGKQIIHPAHSAFMPAGWHGVLGAIATGGIVFAFNGFKQAAELAGEAKNPGVALPLAIVGSVVICLLIFILLQVAFLVSLHKSNLIHGWPDLLLANNNSPLVSVLSQNHLSWVVPLVYFGAIISPLAAALIYCSSSSRSLYGMSQNGYIPAVFSKLTLQGNPIYAILVTFVIGMCLFAPLPGWNKMVAFLTSLMALTYAVGPVALVTLRHQAKNQHRPYKLPFAKVWATIAFYLCTLMAYWSGWDIISKMSLGMFIGLAGLVIYHKSSERGREVQFNWRASIWLWPYFIGLSLISYLGSYGGGTDILKHGSDLVVLALFCVGIMWLANHFCLPAEVTQAHIKALKLGQNYGQVKTTDAKN